MKNIAAFLFVLFALLLAACEEEGTEATVVPEPTAAVEGTVDSSLDGQIAQLAAIAPPPQPSDKEAGIHILPCLPTVTPGVGEIEGEDYTCGVFTVPQNWDEPDGRSLDLGFVVVKATGENPEPNPLLHLEGGPGASAVLLMDMKMYQALRHDRDIIFLDIRGVGLSQRLGYEECLVLALQNDAPEEQIEALRVAAPNLLAAASGEAASQAPSAWELDHPVLNEICWEQFTAQGIDLNQFSTAANARDMVEFIKASGYESFNIRGSSYGSHLAMTIMDAIPGFDAAPQLRSVCNQAFPNLTGRLGVLLKELEEEPLTANGETVTIDDLVERLTDVLGARAAHLPRMIAELEEGVLDTYLALREGEVSTVSAEAAPPLNWDPSDPVQVFIADASALLSGEEAITFPVYVNYALAEEDPLATLQAFIEESYPGETGDQMLEMLGKLTAGDIATSPYAARWAKAMAFEKGELDPEEQQARLHVQIAKASPPLLYNSIHCIDDILHERFEDAVNNYHDLQFPQLTNLDKSRVTAGRCENWPVDAAAIDVKDPVTSDVPVLILQGAYDKPIPTYMGRRAARELENSIYVLVPQAGHGVWNNAGDCVGQIATAFVQDPEAELDRACLDSRRPQWALPDASVKGESLGG